MLTGFKSLLRPPVVDDPEEAAQASSIHTILLSILVLSFLFLIYAIFFPPLGQLIIAIAAIIIEFGLLVLVQSKRIQLASAILTFTLWAAIVTEVALYGGIRDTGFDAFAAIILIAGLTMGTRGSIIFTALTILAAASLAFTENQGVLPAYAKVPIWSVLLSHSITLIAVVLLLNMAIRNISAVARKAIEKEKKEEEVNVLLEASQADLKQRTSALEQRNITLQAVASVSRLTNQVKNEGELLEQSAMLLLEKINLEYIGIFVLDQIEENVVLQVSRSQAGTPLAPAGNKLNVIRSETASLLMGPNILHFKIGEQNYYIDPPKQLPNLVTSLAFPLISGDRLYGFMNIQTASSDPHIDKQTLQTLADQIALSMANIRLLNQLQNRIQEISLLVGGSVQNAWEQLGSGKPVGYTYDRLKVLPANETFPPEVAAQLLSGKSVTFVSADTPPRARLATPIILRESIIGVVGYDSDNVNHEWHQDEKALIETVASRVSLALENTRLVAEAQQRAERERVIGQVTSRMRETLDIETILKTAVMELRQSLALREAEVRLQLAEESQSTEGSHD
ncbi:MAG: hypothetical protein WCE68_07610 [Anaerolineales bacterium]